VERHTVTSARSSARISHYASSIVIYVLSSMPDTLTVAKVTFSTSSRNCPLAKLYSISSPCIQSTYHLLHSVHLVSPAFSPPTVPCIQSTYHLLHSVHLLSPAFSPDTAPCSQTNYRPCIQSTHCRFSNIQSTSWTIIQNCVWNKILFHFTNMSTLLLAD